jgi:hypothetical protein
VLFLQSLGGPEGLFCLLNLFLMLRNIYRRPLLHHIAVVVACFCFHTSLNPSQLSRRRSPHQHPMDTWSRQGLVVNSLHVWVCVPLRSASHHLGFTKIISVWVLVAGLWWPYLRAPPPPEPRSLPSSSCPSCSDVVDVHPQQFPQPCEGVCRGPSLALPACRLGTTSAGLALQPLLCQE